MEVLSRPPFPKVITHCLMVLPMRERELVAFSASDRSGMANSGAPMSRCPGVSAERSSGSSERQQWPRVQTSFNLSQKSTHLLKGERGVADHSPKMVLR